jgi:DNA-binding MarR family transcriptional regulator
MTEPGAVVSTIDEATTRVMTASRVLVAISARSLSITEAKVTLPQYRALVLLGSRGEQNVRSLADALDVHPSTATRLCDRLIAKRFIERAPSSESRREVSLTLSDEGRALLRTVTNRRRRDVRHILLRLDAGQQRNLIAAFEAFADAAGEVPDDAWKLGWTE